MWRDNLLEIIAESKLTKKQIAERGNLPLKTVLRIINGDTQFPTIDTLDRLATALNCTLGDILAGTRAVIGTRTLTELQDEMTDLRAEKEKITAERDFAVAENTILKEENKTLSAKVELLTMQLNYKDEIIALYKIIEQHKKE